MAHTNHVLNNIAKYSYKDKESNLASYNAYTLARTISMFEWENLPESIPTKQLELLLQTVGYAFVIKHNGGLYALYGGLGGVPDPYGYPTEIVIANPALKLNKTFKLTDGVLIHNDDLDLGLVPMLNRHNTMLVENDINMMLHGFNTRTQRLISASNDRTKESADEYLNKIVDGELTVVGESALFEGLKLHSGSDSSSSSITSLIEFHQYTKASLYNDLGLGDNYNMKRERLTQGETEASEDSNFTFVYNMFKCRLKAVEELNDKFDLELNVSFGSVWAKGKKEVVDDVVEDGELLEVEIDSDGNMTLPPDPDPETDLDSDPENDDPENVEIVDNEQENIDNETELTPSEKEENE